jgi:hypothetical protein
VGVAGPGDVVPAGFWWGLWNGLTFFFAAIGKLFGANVALYEVHNNGGWYDFGYFVGICMALGGSSQASR